MTSSVSDLRNWMDNGKIRTGENRSEQDIVSFRTS